MKRSAQDPAHKKGVQRILRKKGAQRVEVSSLTEWQRSAMQEIDEIYRRAWRKRRR